MKKFILIAIIGSLLIGCSAPREGMKKKLIWNKGYWWESKGGYPKRGPGFLGWSRW